MAKRAEDLDLDPSVVPVGDAPTGSFDEWLASIHGDGRVELTKPAAELVAEVRAGAE
jgi:hypothetical protein